MPRAGPEMISRRVGGVGTAASFIAAFQNLPDYRQFLVIQRTRQNRNGELLAQASWDPPLGSGIHGRLERLGEAGSRRAQSDRLGCRVGLIGRQLAQFADFFSHRNPSPSAFGAYLSPPSPGVLGSENGRPRGSPSTKSMGFQIRLSQQRLGIRAGWPRPETICGSQRTRVDSGGFVSTGVSTKLRNPSKTEEKWSGAGEGNRTLVSGLGSPHSTIEPHPRRETELIENNRRGARTQRWSWSGARWRTASDGSHSVLAQEAATQPKPINVNRSTD